MFGKIIIINLIYKLRKVILKYLQKLFFNRCHNPQKILIHRIGSFGDSIVALPAVWSIRQAYPDAIIHVASTHATPLNLSTVIDDGIIDEFILIKKKDRSYYLKTLQQRHYDLYIEIPQNYGLIKSIRNMIIVRYYLGIKSAFGWDSGWIKIFPKIQQYYCPPLKEVDRFLQILNDQQIPSFLTFPIKYDNSISIKYFQSLSMKKVIAFIVGTNVPANKWCHESWKILAVKLLSEGFGVIVIGGEQEMILGDELSKISPSVINLCGKTSISQSASLLTETVCAVSHDTGAMHLAYAVGTPVVALFSTRQLSTKWHPYGQNHRVIEKFLPCSGCFKKVCENNICMGLITPEEVRRAMDGLI